VTAKVVDLRNSSSVTQKELDSQAMEPPRQVRRQGDGLIVSGLLLFAALVCSGSHNAVRADAGEHRLDNKVEDPAEGTTMFFHELRSKTFHEERSRAFVCSSKGKSRGPQSRQGAPAGGKPMHVNLWDGELKHNVRAIVRVRPMSEEDMAEEERRDNQQRRRGSGVTRQGQDRHKQPASVLERIDFKHLRIGHEVFSFDGVYDGSRGGDVEGTGRIYDECVSEMVAGCLQGRDATVIAYGHTGSGKTHTMGTAPPRHKLELDRTHPRKTGEEERAGGEGIIPRAVAQLFKSMQELPGGERWSVTASFIEIYNEEIYDLLHAPKEAAEAAAAEEEGKAAGRVMLREDARGCVQVVGATEQRMETLEDLRVCLSRASRLRRVGRTAVNEFSSRSHAILTVTVGGAGGRRSKLQLVDLAGSERADEALTHAKAGVLERIHINHSMLALANVMRALACEHAQDRHVPYRGSKLTRLLQDSIGRASRTLMIACVSPGRAHVAEGIKTVRYAAQARTIKSSMNALRLAKAGLGVHSGGARVGLRDEGVGALQLEPHCVRGGLRDKGLVLAACKDWDSSIIQRLAAERDAALAQVQALRKREGMGEVGGEGTLGARALSSRSRAAENSGGEQRAPTCVRAVTASRQERRTVLDVRAAGGCEGLMYTPTPCLSTHGGQRGSGRSAGKGGRKVEWGGACGQTDGRGRVVQMGCGVEERQGEDERRSETELVVRLTRLRREVEGVLEEGQREEQRLLLHLSHLGEIQQRWKALLVDDDRDGMLGEEGGGEGSGGRSGEAGNVIQVEGGDVMPVAHTLQDGGDASHTNASQTTTQLTRSHTSHNKATHTLRDFVSNWLGEMEGTLLGDIAGQSTSPSPYPFPSPSPSPFPSPSPSPSLADIADPTQDDQRYRVDGQGQPVRDPLLRPQTSPFSRSEGGRMQTTGVLGRRAAGTSLARSTLQLQLQGNSSMGERRRARVTDPSLRPQTSLFRPAAARAGR
jgi:hypothetical protein